MQLPLCNWQCPNGAVGISLAELTENDLKSLHTAARKYCSNTSVTECTWLYLNKPVTYFRDIMRKCFGKMEVYPKYNSDDQGSPINGQLSGLFFMANNINGEPPSTLQFGPRRFQVPAEFLFSVAPNVILQTFTVCVVMTTTSHWSLHVSDQMLIFSVVVGCFPSI